MNKPLVVIDIPNAKAMAQVAKHLGYSKKDIEACRKKTPDCFNPPAYIHAKKSRDGTYWGQNLAWSPPHRYNHVTYEIYIKQHGLKPKTYTDKEAQEWLKEQLTAVERQFNTHFPKKKYKSFLRKVTTTTERRSSHG